MPASRDMGSFRTCETETEAGKSILLRPDSPEGVSEVAGATGAGEVLLGGLFAVLQLLLQAAGTILARLPLACKVVDNFIFSVTSARKI